MDDRDIEFCSDHPDEPTDGDACPTCGPLHPLGLDERNDAAWIVRCPNCGWACEEPW